MISGIQVAFIGDIDLSEILNIGNVIYLRNIKALTVDSDSGSYYLTPAELKEFLAGKNKVKISAEMQNIS